MISTGCRDKNQHMGTVFFPCPARIVAYFGRLSVCLQSLCLLFLLAEPFSLFFLHVCLPIHTSRGSVGFQVPENPAF